MAQTINVNTTPGQFMPTLYYSQGDIGRVFEIVLASSDGWSIPSGATVEMVATKPSGFGFTVSGTLTGNVASFTTTATMTNEWGRYPAEIRIKSGNDVIGTANFYLNGERPPHPEGTTDGDAETIIPELTLLVERVEAAAASVLDMTVDTITLPPGSNATYSYDEATNTATFGVPRGADGEVTFDALNGATAVQTLSDNTPYLFRQTAKKTHTENLDKVIGGTVAWNQKVANGNFENTTGWAVGGSRGTLTASNNELSYGITALGTDYSQNRIQQSNFAPILNHKYLLSIMFNTTHADTVRFFFGGGSGNTVFSEISVSTGWNNCASIANYSTDKGNASLCFGFNGTGYSVGETVKFKTFCIFDLTQMFGSTIADAIYAMEQATAGSGVAYFRSLFPNAYYQYNAGELMSVSGVSAHEMVGKNLLPNGWTSKTHNGVTFTANADGTITANGTATADAGVSINLDTSKLYGDYYFNGAYGGSTSTYNLYLWDGTAGARPKMWNGTTGSANGFKELAQVKLIQGHTASITCRVMNGQTANNLKFYPMICRPTTTDSTYEPYELHSYPLDSDLTLRGMPKLDSDNKLYYDGDTYESDGTVTRKYGVVDLGTLTYERYSSWGSNTEMYLTSGIASLIKKPSATNVTANILCPLYTAVSNDASRGSTSDLQISINTAGNLYIINHAYNSATTFKTAMSGVYLVYELATPTTETADPYQKGQVCDPNGTEEFVSTSIVPVGHETEYPQTLSDIKPTANGNYVLKCTVTNGVATYEWVSA